MRISAEAVRLPRGCGRPKARVQHLSIRDRRPPERGGMGPPELSEQERRNTDTTKSSTAGVGPQNALARRASATKPAANGSAEENSRKLTEALPSHLLQPEAVVPPKNLPATAPPAKPPFSVRLPLPTGGVVSVNPSHFATPGRRNAMPNAVVAQWARIPVAASPTASDESDVLAPWPPNALKRAPT